MGKPQNNHGKRVSNQNADPMGNPQSMERYAAKVFRDIAHGNFDIFKEGYIFNNPMFLQAAIRYSATMMNKGIIHRNAMNIAYPNSEDPMIQNVYNSDTMCIEAYQWIYNTMIQIQATGDTGYLLTLSTKLPPLKFNM